MATPTSQNNNPFFKAADARDKTNSFATKDRPTSLYQPRQPSSFGQTTQSGAFGQTGSAFGQASAGSAFTRTEQPGQFGAGAKPTFGNVQPGRLGTPQPGTQGFGAKPQPKPFTSLRSQTTPDGSAASPFSRFAKPAPAGQPANTFGQRTGQAPVSAFARPQTESAPRAASPFRKDMYITDEEFLLIRDFIYQQCGIFIAENRKYLVENRLSNRLKDLNLKSYNEYYNFLRFDNNRKQELNRLFEVVTTNETSFFRNPPQLEVFQRVVLAEAIEQCRKTGQKRLRLWSAGCSTGEEPYTLAIILHETLRGEIANWDIKITANDLSEAVLAAARQGIYNDYALRTTPKEIVARYFRKNENVYHINPELKRLVSFGPINLSDKDQLRRVEKSQIVFCRNVIIYFDDDMKRKVINAFYDNLQPNGVLIIGHSESLHNISRAFQLEHHKGTILYRKSS